MDRRAYIQALISRYVRPGVENPQAILAGRIRTAMNHLRTKDVQWTKHLLGLTRDDLPPVPVDDPSRAILTFKTPLNKIDLTTVDGFIAATDKDNLIWATRDDVNAVRTALASAARVARGPYKRGGGSQPVSIHVIKALREVDAAMLVMAPSAPRENLNLARATLQHVYDALTS